MTTERVKVTVTFELWPEDINRLAAIPKCAHCDGMDTDELLKLWKGLTIGDDDVEPCDKAWESFYEALEPIWKKVRNPLERLARI